MLYVINAQGDNTFMLKTITIARVWKLLNIVAAIAIKKALKLKKDKRH